MYLFRHHILSLLVLVVRDTFSFVAYKWICCMENQLHFVLKISYNVCNNNFMVS